MNDWRKKDETEALSLGHESKGMDREEAKVHHEQTAEEDELKLDSSFDELLNVIKHDHEQLDRTVNIDSNPELSGRLDEALALGLDMGRRRNGRKRTKRMSLQVSAAVVVMLFVLTAFVRISPSFAAIVKEIPGFGGFVELISYDRSLQTALDNEYIQVVGKSDERNGYKLTVNGVLADAQRVVLLYTAEGPGINEEDTTFLPYELYDENGGDIEAGIGSSHYFRETDDKDGGVQDYLDIMMAPGVPVPQEIQFKLEVGGEWLEVQVPIDHSRFAEMTEEIKLDESIEVAGQRIELTKAVITPLQVSITLKGDPNNTKRLNDFIDLELVDDKGRSYQTNSGMGDLDTEIVRHFQSSYFQKPKSLTLKAKGLLMSDRGMKVVIDTEQGKLLEAPDGRLKLSEVKKSEKAIDLVFELYQEDDPQRVMRGINLFGFNGVTRDAKGTAYSVTRGESNGTKVSQFGSGNMNLITYYYHIPNADYVQPLTLEIDQYLGHAFKDISIPIR